MNQDTIWDHFQNEGVDSFAGTSARIEFVVRRLSPGERVLNIGVGSGTFERMAAEKKADVWVLDPSERAIARVRSALGLGEQAQTGYSQDMPFPSDHFDTVVMSEVIEHLDPDVLEGTLGEVHRVLRPGGRFIGTVPAGEDLSLSEVVCPNCSHHFHRWGHVSSFDAVTLRRRLETRFAVEQIDEHFFIEWEGAGWRSRMTGLVKKFLSARRIGTYGTNRNLYFAARKAA